jgi:hypothetical protein
LKKEDRMRKQRDARAGRAKLVASLAVGLAAVVGTVTPALASDVLELEPPPGMMTVGRSQEIILGAVLTQPQDPDHEGCWLTASLVDASGNVVSNLAGIQQKKRFVLRGNVADELSVRTNEILAPGQIRKALRWMVEKTPDRGVVSFCCSLVISEEILFLLRPRAIVPMTLKQLALHDTEVCPAQVPQ